MAGVTTVIQAGPHEGLIIRALWQLYVHELCLLDPFPVPDSGRYAEGQLDDFFAGGEDKRAYLISRDGRVAGFCLLLCSPSRTEVDQLFIHPAYRRKGIGREAMRQLFALIDGEWSAFVLNRNAPASRFWRSVIGPRMREVVSTQQYGQPGSVFCFSVRGASEAG